ncbi:ParA family protein [Hyphomonas pacifica]|uniref:ParA family protein n=1 Tax=Hyphomonas pacifica TaxID=1280941 RepID=UPI000DBFE635|nr:ParA family protein [Hyphomonas pacifica]RAN32041.1 hypothetical protein HY11_05565 [Hyphomonas pacifica]
MVDVIFGSVWATVATIAGALSIVTGLFGFGYRVGHWRGHLKNPDEMAVRQANRERDVAEQQLNEIKGQIALRSSEVRRYSALKEALIGGEKALWNSHRTEPFEGYDRLVQTNDVHVLTVMNLKGGVGKTTLATNLAAYFDQHLNKRVLFVDLDYQGSATTAMLNLVGLEDIPTQNASKVFTEQGRLPSVAELALHAMRPLARTELVPCNYSFSAIENKEMVKWLFQENQTDPRFALAKVIFSDEFRERYDVVIIDAPPRLSLGAINALTCCRTILVPTIPDSMSTEAVGNFTAQLNSLAPILNPSLSKLLLGVNKTGATKMNPAEIRAVERAFEDMRNWNGISRVVPTNIPDRVAFSKASTERSLAWLLNDTNAVQIRDIISKFGDYVARETGII